MPKHNGFYLSPGDAFFGMLWSAGISVGLALSSPPDFLWVIAIAAVPFLFFLIVLLAHARKKSGSSSSDWQGWWWQVDIKTPVLLMVISVVLFFYHIVRENAWDVLWIYAFSFVLSLFFLLVSFGKGRRKR